MPPPAIGIGFESLSGDANFQDLRDQFDAHAIPGYSISLGRPEWKAVPIGDEDDWAPMTSDSTDKVADAIDTLSSGTDRTLVTTIDALSPRWNEQDPDLAGAYAGGEPATSFPSATSLVSGPVGEGIEDLCRAAAERYSPDRIALTELLGDTFFSDEDEELYSQMTGADGFPRLDNGDIDLDDEQLNRWQSDVITSVITRCQDASDTDVEIDVRVNWENPGADRADSGHRYQDLLDAGAHLTLWAYTGTGGVEPEQTGELVDGLTERFTPEQLERITISVGLWGGGDDVLSAESISRSLTAVGSELPVLLTPVSLMTDEHWQMLPDAVETKTMSPPA